MTDDTSRWEAVDDYYDDALSISDSALRGALARSAEAGLPEIAVTPNQGRLLSLMAKSAGAARILEVGTLGGYSTIWLARALPAGGQLVTCELDPKHAEVARQNLTDAGCADLVTIHVGPAAETLSALVSGNEPAFDFVFIDADKESYLTYFELALKLTRPGGLIVLDNVVRKGEVANPETTDPRVQGVRACVELLSRETRVEATAIQTVGAKGYDGFILARVLE
ncbi:MAG: O-methyltransferase [Spirochaetaceae bacterium]|nr:MAG: O-methyltransferase [Spirochaetaceae bacterium]